MACCRPWRGAPGLTTLGLPAALAIRAKRGFFFLLVSTCRVFSRTVRLLAHHGDLAQALLRLRQQGHRGHAGAAVLGLQRQDPAVAVVVEPLVRQRRGFGVQRDGVDDVAVRDPGSAVRDADEARLTRRRSGEWSQLPVNRLGSQGDRLERAVTVGDVCVLGALRPVQVELDGDRVGVVYVAVEAGDHDIGRRWLRRRRTGRTAVVRRRGWNPELGRAVVGAIVVADTVTVGVGTPLGGSVTGDCGTDIGGVGHPVPVLVQRLEVRSWTVVPWRRWEGRRSRS